MTRTLFIVAGFCLALALGLFIVGLTSQSAFGFAGALLCGMPSFFFFFGGGFFTLFAHYRLVPKDMPSAAVTNGRKRVIEPLT